jgi:flagellar hook-basal body complex protein FliE
MRSNAVSAGKSMTSKRERAISAPPVKRKREKMNKAELIETIYAERAKVADEQDRAEGDDLALLEGWEKALSWVVRQINKEGEQC